MRLRPGNSTGEKAPVGAKPLSTTGTTVQTAPTVACDASVTCTVAATNITYPYTLPAGVTAPTATKLYNAGPDTGMGNQTVTQPPARSTRSRRRIYISTWTYGARRARRERAPVAVAELLARIGENVAPHTRQVCRATPALLRRVRRRSWPEF